MSTLNNIGGAGAGRDRDQNERVAHSPPGESVLALPASNPSLMAQVSQFPVPLPLELQHLASLLQRGSTMASIPSVAMAGNPSGVNLLNQVLQQGQQLEPPLTLQTLAEFAGRMEQRSAPSQQHLTTGLASQYISQGAAGGQDATQSNVLSSNPGGEASAASKPYLIPCRARGMSEDHDFRVSWMSFAKPINYILSIISHPSFISCLAECSFCHSTQYSTRGGANLLL